MNITLLKNILEFTKNKFTTINYLVLNMVHLNTGKMPIRHEAPVTYWLIVGNALFFFFMLFMMNINLFVYIFGFLPKRFLFSMTSEGSILFNIFTIYSSMFIHMGLLHILFNMIFLAIFGVGTEKTIGSKYFAILYFTSGTIAALLQFATDTKSEIPMIGASGAISGIFGAFFILHPKAKLTLLSPLFFFIPIAEISTFVFGLFWLGLQLLGWISSISNENQVGQVAFYAHIGGFLAGILIIVLLYGYYKNNFQKVKLWYKDITSSIYNLKTKKEISRAYRIDNPIYDYESPFNKNIYSNYNNPLYNLNFDEQFADDFNNNFIDLLNMIKEMQKKHGRIGGYKKYLQTPFRKKIIINWRNEDD